MPRRSLAACVAVAFVSTAPAADPKPEEVVGQLVALRTKVTAQAAELLGGVKDEKTAGDAKPHLDDLGERYAAYKAAVETLLPLHRDKLPKAALDAMAGADDALLREHDRVFSKAKAAYKVLREEGFLIDYLERSMEMRAAESANRFRSLIAAYAAKNRGEYPKELKAVPPLVEGGEKALADPWGYPYHFEPGKRTIDKVEVPVHYVWTVSPYSGKKLGHPPPEKK
jgi:hypothetical protein